MQSTKEAEYVNAVSGAKELVWLYVQQVIFVDLSQIHWTMFVHLGTRTLNKFKKYCANKIKFASEVHWRQSSEDVQC